MLWNVWLQRWRIMLIDYHHGQAFLTVMLDHHWRFQSISWTNHNHHSHSHESWHDQSYESLNMDRFWSVLIGYNDHSKGFAVAWTTKCCTGCTRVRSRLSQGGSGEASMIYITKIHENHEKYKCSEWLEKSWNTLKPQASSPWWRHTFGRKMSRVIHWTSRPAISIDPFFKPSRPRETCE